MEINYYGYYYDYTINRSAALMDSNFEEAMGNTTRGRFNYFYNDIDKEFKELLAECYNCLELMITTKHLGNSDRYELYKSAEKRASEELLKLALELDNNQD